MNFYHDYEWKRGRPSGVGKEFDTLEMGYKVVADPYYKRISVEKYEEGKFREVIYDSALFDFRHLRAEDASWQREVINENGPFITSLVRNMEDRIIFIEIAEFQEDKCLECKILSPHLVPIGKQLIFDTARGDSWNGVLLMDVLGKTILQKRYEKDPVTGDFSNLLEEVWG